MGKSTWSTKVGNTKETLEFVLSDALGAVDLTGCTVRFQMRKDGSATTKVDQPATINPNQTDFRGWVSYESADDDFDEAGKFLGEFKVTFPDGKVTDFPNGDNYIEITVGEGVADIPEP